MVGLQDSDDESGPFIPAGPSNQRRADSPRNNGDDHDYTENASAADIAQALEQQRKEGEEVIGQNMEGGGVDSGSAAIWSGEAGFSVPSSITSMHFMHQARRPSMALRRSSSRARMSYGEDRRYSRDYNGSHSRRGSTAYSNYDNEDYDYQQRESRPRILRDDSRTSRRSQAVSDADGEWDNESPLDVDEIAPPSPGLLPRIASALGFHQHNNKDVEDLGETGSMRRRRRSSARSARSGRSRRTSGSSYRRSGDSARSRDEDEDRSGSESEENWGYSSNERDTYSEMSGGDRDDDDQSFRSSLADDTSLPPQSRPSSPIPLLPSDGIFGDPQGASGDQSSIQLFTDISSASKQTINLPDEDLSIRFTGYVTSTFNSLIWMVGCILTLGGLGLIGRWVPNIWVRWCGRETDFEKSGKEGWLVVETPYGDLHIVKQEVVGYPYPLSTVFPQALTGKVNGNGIGVGNGSKAPTVASTNGSRAPSIMAAAVARAHAPSGATEDGSNGAPSSAGGAKDLMTVDLEAGQTSFEETMGHLKTAEYRYTKFALQPGTGRWCLIRDWRDLKWTSVKAVASGLGKEVREQRRILFGDNVIDIEGKGVVGLLLDEVLHPFYVFQIASIALWSIDDYYYYAFAIALISVSSILSTLIETKRTIERMREMSRFSCDVRVLVDGEWTTMDSASLVPGDIFEASDPSLTVFPCDALLLSGDAIVNESMLTGESVPVSKVPVKDDVIRSLAREDKKGSTEVDAEIAKHYLFSGTKIIRVRPGGSIMGLGGKSDAQRALAMVTRTGFNTTKGALVRSMLFPKPMGFKFYRDSMRFIGVLAMIAGFGFAISAVQFIRMGIAWYTILIRALDLITIVVPPALPATLTIGTTFAIDRLRKLGVFCISPNRVNIGGKVNVFCFDKTGTLTEEGLDVLGVRTVDKYSERFSELHGEVDEVPDRGGSNGKTPLLYALATCHSLKLIDGEILGDPLDIKMFEWTGWTLDEGRSKPAAAANGDALSKEARVVDRPQTLVQTVVRPPGAERWKLEDALKSGGKHAHFLELGVIRTFDFVSALRRMSVIVKRLKANSMEIYVKGAPEVMPDICDPETFPSDYDDMLSYYTRNGFRVIAIAGKSVEGLTWLKAQRMKREQAESGLHFLGFIVFENKLKEATTPAVHALRSAHIACRMVTGDNVRTAISVARECGLVSHSASVYIPTFASGGSHNPDSEITWTSVDDEKHKLNSYSLKPIVQEYAMGFDPGETEQPDYQLALTGDVFRWMLEFAPLETMQRMLVKGVIFARMSPDEKAELVERLQALGYTVGFCGDGANDCGALKTADIGISLSEAEASVAAPFTSHITDISCVIEVIKEGRAALVTSFSCFKYMALYSLIQFTTVTLLYSFASSLGDFQFLYIDLFIIIPIAVAMGRTLPYPKIHPKRPTASLVSKKVLTSIIGQTIINFAIQVFVFIWIRRQPWYTKPDVDDEKLETFNYENTALFLVSCFQYILVAVVFSVGPPYRKPIYSNLSLVGCFVVLTAFSSYVLLAPSKSIALLLDIIELTYRFRFELLAIIIVNIVSCFAFERYAERPLARLVGNIRKWFARRGGRSRRVTGGKAYKHIEVN